MANTKPTTASHDPTPSPAKKSGQVVDVISSDKPTKGILTDQTRARVMVRTHEGRERKILVASNIGSAVELATVTHEGETKRAWLLKPYYRDMGWVLLGLASKDK